MVAAQSATSWVAPLSAAAQTLVACLIIFALLQRAVRLGENQAYLSLERAALVENLDSQEIRTRFVTQLLGPEIGEWLRGMGPRLVEADDKLTQAVSAAKTQLTEIDNRNLTIIDFNEVREEASARLTSGCLP